MSELKSNQDIYEKNDNSNWNWLYKIGGIAALIIVIFIPIQALIYVLYPPPTTVMGYFTLFQSNWIIGLLDMDFIYLFSNTLLIAVYLALYVALKKTNKSFMTIALALGLVGITTFFTSKPSLEMLSLSTQYAAATTEAQKTIILGAGQTLLAIYSGTAFDVYYILNAITLLIIAFVMLQSNIFSRATAYSGIISGLLMLIPSTAGTIGMIFAFLSLIPWIVFSVLIALRFFKLGKDTQNEVNRN